MATKKQLQRNFAVSREVEEKLLKLRNYHNKTYNNLFEILIENAYLSMEESVNLTKGKELEEQNLKVSFQVQQLTLMFSELKKELAEVKTQYQSVKEQLEIDNEKQGALINLVNEEKTNNKGRSERYSQQIKSINEWINKKDNSFLGKLL